MKQLPQPQAEQTKEARRLLRGLLEPILEERRYYRRLLGLAVRYQHAHVHPLREYAEVWDEIKGALE